RRIFPRSSSRPKQNSHCSTTRSATASSGRTHDERSGTRLADLCADGSVSQISNHGRVQPSQQLRSHPLRNQDTRDTNFLKWPIFRLSEDHRPGCPYVVALKMTFNSRSCTRSRIAGIHASRQKLESSLLGINLV